MNSTKYQLKPIKDVIDTNSGAFGKTGARISELEKSAFLFFLNFFENTLPIVVGESYVQLFESFSGKKIHLNRSSERKVMPVLRRTLRISFCRLIFFRWQRMEETKLT
jgi:hypothetical protein